MSFDQFIEANPEFKNIHALVAFSGKLTGKEIMHADDGEQARESFAVEEDAEFTESNMNPNVNGQDLRIAFDRPEYRVMLVANKFQTGFDQPKLVAMYVDKKIANSVEIVQTLSRLNRNFPGKDQTFVIDFVNDPEVVQNAFTMYDAGAKIETVQDLNVVYDMKDNLDNHGIYHAQDIEAFQVARYQTARDFTGSADPKHKAMFSATQEPTDTYNSRLKALKEEAQKAEEDYLAARASNNETGMNKADHDRVQIEESIGQLTEFKAGLTRFSRTYAYVAQLIDLGDPNLESFAAFTKLLANRLDGIPPEDVDLKGITLTGYDIRISDDQGGDDVDEPVLQPITGGGSSRPGATPVYLKEIIERLNSLFGEAAPLKDKAHFVNQIANIARENKVVMAQVDKNPKAQALKGNLPGAVQGAVVRAMTSHSKLAGMLLKEDKQSLTILTNMIYDMLKSGDTIDLGDIDSQ